MCNLIYNKNKGYIIHFLNNKHVEFSILILKKNHLAPGFHDCLLPRPSHTL